MILLTRKKLIRDLKGIKDMLVAAGDPFLASVINRAIGCVENQPVILMGLDLASDGSMVKVRCGKCKHHGFLHLGPFGILNCADAPEDSYCAWGEPQTEEVADG